ncbi:hypothetical protein IOQ59_07280 [Pontibacterium sp. N1Y112]|uniref:Uncharacterized protein n=1 Tax=Pontibacterium sinense TaxID=2781979 RepID=A0A8J7FJ33_9GAMM|nr:hypothetical protein [Pontibacterium sinense]MBE9397063.1 hypothetical protein [Pontibacterium sinense]
MTSDIVDGLLTIGALLLTGAAFIAYNHKKFYIDSLYPFGMLITISLMAWIASAYYHSMHFAELINSHDKEVVVQSIDYLKYNAEILILFGAIIVLSFTLLMFIPNKSNNHSND